MESSYNLFEQNAQDPLADFDVMYPELAKLQREPKKKRTKRGSQEHLASPKKPRSQNASSYVYSSETRRGIRLIRVEVVDLENKSAVQSDGENEKLLYSVQYVVTDTINPIMDQTEQLITNISKKICDYNF